MTHDVGETLAFGRVLVVEQGRIVEDGRPDLALANSRYRQLLAAERDLRRRAWADTNWRRLRLDGGRLVGNRAGRPMKAATPEERPRPPARAACPR